ncbi:MAG: GAF domain-containing protein [Anaerolineae bacterium]|nr:GAF domain-containing protein [Anaerolineae bacterium]
MLIPVSWLSWPKRLKLRLDRWVGHKWLNMGLRTKMGAIVLIGLAGLLSIFALLGISTSQETTQQVLRERLMLARLSAANLDATFHHVESVLTIIAQEATWRDPKANLTARVKLLQTGFDQVDSFSRGFFLLDPTGRPTASATDQAVNLDWEWVAAEHYTLNKQQFNLSITPGEHPLAVITTPVYDGRGVLLGSLAALLDLSDPKLSPFNRPFDLGATGTLEVVDMRGQVLLSTQPGRVLTANEQDNMLRLLGADKPMVETCDGCSTDMLSQSGDQVMAFAPLSQVPWAVIIRQEADEVFAPVRRLMFQTSILGLAAVLGAMGLVWITTNSVINPMQLLMEAAGRIATGDLTTPICCQRGDEIGALAYSFDTMRAQLKYSIEEIQAWNHELDARVQERTQAALTAQVEAQAAHDDLRAIIDGLSDELIVVSLDGQIQLMNKAAQIHCVDSEAVYNRFCHEVFHHVRPCRPPDQACPISIVIATDEPVKMTHIHQDPGTGQKRYLDIVASPMYDSAGRITRVIELRRNVTEERELAEALIRRNQELSILNAVAITVNQSLDLGEILDRTLAEVLRLTEVDAGAIFLLEETAGKLELLAHHGLSAEAAQLAAQLGMLDGSCGGVIERGQIVIVPDLARYRGKRAESLKREKLKTLVHVPLVAKGCTLGSICIATRCPHEFNTEEQALLTALGNQIAVAIENARLYAEVQHKEHMRGELLKKVISAQEEERKRIARDLHDDTSQTLTALLFAAEEAMEMNALDEIKEQLENMHYLVTLTLNGVHKLIFDLRPTMLDHLGLVPALRWFAESRLEQVGVRVKIEEISTARRLPAEVETALFRVVQEAINNIARHAGARNVYIAFDFADETTKIKVEDDGLGFDLIKVSLSPDTRRGLGVMGMQERVELLGGQVDIITAPGYGTQLHIQVPTTVEQRMAYV